MVVRLNATKGLLSSGNAGGGGFQAYAAGNKVYGQGRSMPNVGKTTEKAAYGRRDGAMAARREALLNRAKGYL